jgi:hypothetical protein
MSPAKLIPFPPFTERDRDDCCPLASKIAEHEQAIEELQNERLSLKQELHSLALRVDDKFSTMQYWLMGIFASTTVGAVGLLLKIALGK